MKTFSHTIIDKLGLHARTAVKLVKESKKFNSKITIKNGDKTAETTHLIGLMSLGAECGKVITVTVCGEDEESASEEFQLFLNKNL